jgi:hypothetical protein
MPVTSSTRPGRRPDPAVRSLWEQRLCAFERSGLSPSAFCARERLSLPSFYSWRRRLREQPPGLTARRPDPASAELPFLPIHLAPAAPPVEVLLPSGPVLRLAPGCDLAFVRSLVEALGELPC